MQPNRSPEDQRWGADYRMLAALARNHYNDAVQVGMARGSPGTFNKWVVAAHLAGWDLTQWAEPMLHYARATVAATGSPDFANAFTDTRDLIRALVHDAVLTGDVTMVSELTHWVRTGMHRADPSDPEPEGMLYALDARRALLSGDTAAAIERLELSLRRAPWWVSPWAPLASAATERMLLARLHASTGKSRNAEVWLNTFGNIGAIGDLAYVPLVAALRKQLDIDGPRSSARAGTRARSGRPTWQSPKQAWLGPGARVSLSSPARYQRLTQPAPPALTWSRIYTCIFDAVLVGCPQE
jgi:hypothetical protein